MLNFLIEGRGPQFCDRIGRRTALEIGSLSTLGIGLPAVLRAAKATAKSPSPTFGKTKRVILLYMWGGPAHQDTWDLKPHGPSETRGEFLPIATRSPGVFISEHFPKLAEHTNKLAIIRSVGQEDNNHSTGAHAALTGRRHELQAESFGARDSDFPHFGSVLSHLRPNQAGLPSFVSLPEVIATTNGAITPGQNAGFLGRQYDPFRINQHPDTADFSVRSLTIPDSFSPQRLHRSSQLLKKIEQQARLSEQSKTVQAMGRIYQQALSMVLSPKARKAFDLASEKTTDRQRYGLHTFGQSVLLARRLIEAGVQFVTVYWHREEPTIDTSWDTHALNFQELKNRLMPAVDRPISSLLEDLQSRGLLDETLVVWNSEFGRTPRINDNAGRDHWGPCNSVVMAGGGIPGGQVFGASDENAAFPTRDKVTQDDIAATIYHLLGVPPETTLYDRLQRPHALALGTPITRLLSGTALPRNTEAPQNLSGGFQTGPFTHMLRERGLRFLNLDIGNPESEKAWSLDGWSEVSGVGIDCGRSLQKSSATVTYHGLFYTHFDYRWLALRLNNRQTLAGVTLHVAGRKLPLSPSLFQSGERQLWQIPFPEGLIAVTSKFSLEIQAPRWFVTDIVLLGNRIENSHLKDVSSTSHKT